MCAAPGCTRDLPPRRRRFCSDDCRRAGHRWERVTENEEFARMTVRMVRTLGKRVGAADLAVFAALWELAAEADRAAIVAVDDLREHGYSWAEIGAAVGTSKQAMSQWRKRREEREA